MLFNWLVVLDYIHVVPSDVIQFVVLPQGVLVSKWGVLQPVKKEATLVERAASLSNSMQTTVWQNKVHPLEEDVTFLCLMDKWKLVVK